MMRRLTIILGVPAAALVTALALVTPASADSGTGCSGATCSVSLTDLIKLGGDAGPGSVQVPINVDPPPCLWQPIGDATTGSQAIISEWGPNPPTDLGIADSYNLAQKLVKNPVPGTWYLLPINPAASPAGKAECLKIPLYAWVLPGQTPPAPPVPPLTLAEFAFNHLTIPKPALQLNPAGQGFVNLGTYVWANWPASPTTGRQDAYKITASLGNQIVTVWAQAQQLQIGASGNGTPYDSNCTATGSRYPAGSPPANAGPGVAPDCGVLWHAAGTGSTVSATVVWNVTWGVGDLNGPGPNTVPGGQDIQLTGQTPPFAVNEIQSVNGG